MEFLSISDFENYIKFKGYIIIDPSPYPGEFIQRLRAYKIDVIFDEADDSFQYYSQIFTDIDFPFAALIDLTGNNASIKIALKRQ